MFKLIFSLLLVGSAFGLFFGFVGPTYEAVQEKQAQVERYETALQKTREIQELKRTLLSRFNVFSGPNIDRLQKLLPDHVDNVRLVLDIDGIASRYGIRLGNVEVQAQKRTEDEDVSSVVIGSSGRNSNYRSLILKFDVSASYDNLIYFLRDLESSLRVTDLVSMNLERVDNASDTSFLVSGIEDVTPATLGSVYRASIAIQTYWLNE
jgi:Tfp pilus assembly protein PilO